VTHQHRRAAQGMVLDQLLRHVKRPQCHIR
jgi:hypothetical protein